MRNLLLSLAILSFSPASLFAADVPKFGYALGQIDAFSDGELMTVVYINSQKNWEENKALASSYTDSELDALIPYLKKGGLVEMNESTFEIGGGKATINKAREILRSIDTENFYFDPDLQDFMDSIDAKDAKNTVLQIPLMSHATLSLLSEHNTELRKHGSDPVPQYIRVWNGSERFMNWVGYTQKVGLPTPVSKVGRLIDFDNPMAGISICFDGPMEGVPEILKSLVGGVLDQSFEVLDIEAGKYKDFRNGIMVPGLKIRAKSATDPDGSAHVIRQCLNKAEIARLKGEIIYRR